MIVWLKKLNSKTAIPLHNSAKPYEYETFKIGESPSDSAVKVVTIEMHKLFSIWMNLSFLFFVPLF